MGNAPFLYDHPSKYSFTGPTDKAWDPKAVSRASYAASTASPPRPKQEGPLIDAKEFNRHPDSYFAGVAILHTIYAIYHLARSAKARTAASSASYMIFASILDVGLIPFLVFTAIMAHDQNVQRSDAPGHWTTLFMFDTTTTKIIYVTCLVSVVNGSLHLISLIFSIYLAVVFRKISALPPDMNPLEDNLTSRHKRNKSELLDNRNSHASTTISSKHDSRVEEPLIAPGRSVPFMHTHTAPTPNINNVTHPQFSPRTSQTNISATFHDQSLLDCSSRTNFPQHSFHSPPRSQPKSRSNVQSASGNEDHTTADNRLPNEPLILRSPTKSSSIYTNDIMTSRPTSTRPPSTRPPTTRSLSTAPSLATSAVTEDNNWITHPSPTPSPPAEFKHLRNGIPYQPLPQTSRYVENIENRTPRPLEMNPPTPVNASYSMQEAKSGTTLDQRALMPGTGNMLGLRGKLDFNPPKGKEGQQQRLGDRYGELTSGMDDAHGKIRGAGGYSYQNGASGRGGGRVVSRSGVEVGGAQEMDLAKGIRAREVSGKRVEEGRSKSMGGGWGMAR
ncbi:MAG: hypothetical protein Q9209_007629 [Squamulea sp. 1 TL-2023]